MLSRSYILTFSQTPSPQNSSQRDPVGATLNLTRMNCKHCNAPFTIDAQDQDFYQKVSPEIKGQKLQLPEPTLCPPCREQRRMAFRNERKLYNRRCDLTQKQIISLYAPDSKYKAYETSAWWGDTWDALDYGRDFDFSKPFFIQFQALQLAVPRMSLNSIGNENCDFTSFTGYNKNCYLIHTADQCEDCYYGVYGLRNKNCTDFLFSYDNEYCYEVHDTYKCYNIFWGSNVASCYDSYFIEDCVGCHDCIMCVGLKHKSYCYQNQEYSPEAFAKIKAQFLENFSSKIAQYKKEFTTFALTIPHPAVHITNAENCTGDFIQNSRNLTQCFDIAKAEDCKYCSFIEGCKDSYDWTFYSDNGELGYELASVANNVYHCLFSTNCWGRSTDLMYCDLCQYCENCFGCVGLKHKKFCIFNKQYTEEEYYRLVPQIIEHMRQTKEWGEFFPITLSPFAYNETVAQEHYPITPEQAHTENIHWKNIEEYNRYEGQRTVPPEDIKLVTDDIIKEILTCNSCEKNYRIISQELNFYRTHNLPIPQNCFNCRHQNRVNARNGRQLYARQCNHCHKELLTTYNPTRPEIIYCQECYQIQL